MTRSAARSFRLLRRWMIVIAMVLGLLPAVGTSMSASAEGEPGGGLSPDKLWVNVRLEQPPSRRAGSNPRSGWALRYERIGERPGCVVVTFEGQAPPERPWFGNDDNPVAALVLLVNRADPAQRRVLGRGCLAPGELVQTPTREEVLAALDQDILAQPRVNSSPGNRGLTGMESWFWTSSDGHGEVAINLRGFTVQATADAKYHWSTGDDGNYETGSGGTPQNPAVRHVYNSKSPGSGYNVTLDMIWEGEYNWFGFGDAGAGQLGPVTRSGTRSYPVNEVRSVLQ
jgi:hypothetical protein